MLPMTSAPSKKIPLFLVISRRNSEAFLHDFYNSLTNCCTVLRNWLVHNTIGLLAMAISLVSKPCLAAATGGLESGPTPERKKLFALAPGSPIRVGRAPGSIALGDVNQDAKPDLVVASASGITVLLGKGDGKFQIARSSPIHVPRWPSEMVLRDFNGDGKLDIAFANHDSYEAFVLLGDGRGSFALTTNSQVLMKRGEHPHTHGLLAGDLNEDGRLDLVSVNNADNDVSIAFGDGKGGFKPSSASLPMGPSPYPGALADVNGDGHLDIIATSTGRRSADETESTRALMVLFGDGRGNFQTRRVPLRTVLPWFVAVADVNGDHHPDLVVTHTERPELTVLLGNGKGDFTEAPNSPFNIGHSAWHVAMADVNGDGKKDVTVAAGTGIRVFLGDGNGGFAPAPGSPFGPTKGTWQVAIDDINGDGKPDMAATDVESDTVTVWLGQ